MASPARHLAVAAFALLFASVGVVHADTPTAGASPATPGMNVSISFVRDAADPKRITCMAEISDIDTGEVLSAPKIQFLAGAPAKARSGSQSDDGRTEREIVVDVSATPEGNSVSYAVTRIVNGKTIAVQKGSLTVR